MWQLWNSPYDHDVKIKVIKIIFESGMGVIPLTDP
jgi:hypothetical protein